MEQLKDLKKRLVCLVESQINGDLSTVDAKELGEVMDMAKDCAETMYYCAVVDAMEKSSQEEKERRLHEYAPETRFYTPMNARPIRYYTEPHEDWQRKGMTEPTTRDYREGRSPMARRTYMEMKEQSRDPQTKMAQMEQYIKDLHSDWSEMATTKEEKDMLRQKVTAALAKL